MMRRRSQDEPGQPKDEGSAGRQRRRERSPKYRSRERDRYVQHAITVFLDEFNDVCPGAYRTLEKDVYPSFREARELTKPVNEGRRTIADGAPPMLPLWAVSYSFRAGDWEEMEAPRTNHLDPARQRLARQRRQKIEASPPLCRLRDELHQWARPFPGFDSPVMLDIALRTLLNIDHERDLGRLADPPFVDVATAPPFVCEIPGTAVPRGEEIVQDRLERIRRGELDRDEREALLALGSLVPEAGSPRGAARTGRIRVFHYGPYMPQWHDPKQFHAAARAACKEELGRELTTWERDTLVGVLRSYIRARDAEAEAEGMARSPGKRAAPFGRDDDDPGARRTFRRLARRCAGHGSKDIARDEGVSPRAVRASNRSLAEVIGLVW
jgi:hypothetical protein